MKRLIALLTIVGCLVGAGGAAAWSSSQARATAGVWVNNHCGERDQYGTVIFRCDWWVLTSLTQTGINQRNRAQWKFSANGEESRVVRNPFLPAAQQCTYFGYIDPYGTLLSPGKICSPIVI